jgi:hypothetical protein
MTGGEIATLKWLASLVKSLLGAWAGKQKASSERAAEAARHLYTALKWLDSASQDFVYLLTALAEGTPEARDPFMYSVSGVGGALTAVEKAVKDIDPQLSIHFPEVARSIEDAVISRRPTVSEASNALFDYTNEQNGTPSGGGARRDQSRNRGTPSGCGRAVLLQGEFLRFGRCPKPVRSATVS